jgi:hypothetical protein
VPSAAGVPEANATTTSPVIRIGQPAPTRPRMTLSNVAPASPSASARSPATPTTADLTSALGPDSSSAWPRASLSARDHTAGGWAVGFPPAERPAPRRRPAASTIRTRVAVPPMSMPSATGPGRRPAIAAYAADASALSAASTSSPAASGWYGAHPTS